ncbi:MAG: VWA domain-containing protein, partial [Bacteroidales bacterium]
ITELAAVLAFSAIHNNDKVGVIFFSKEIEKFIPPKKGTTHILRIIRELINFTPKYSGTDTANALRYLTNAIKKKSIAFLMTDFLDKEFDNALKIANKKHDVIALKINDVREKELPDAGLIKVKDAESGATRWIDTSNTLLRKIFKENKIKSDEALNDLFIRRGVDNVELYTDKDYVMPLMKLFKKRESRW